MVSPNTNALPDTAPYQQQSSPQPAAAPSPLGRTSTTERPGGVDIKELLLAPAPRVEALTPPRSSNQRRLTPVTE